ncbi:hypothetical protein GCM10020000_38320 [Streptomyces olivoverticillatus]
MVLGVPESGLCAISEDCGHEQFSQSSSRRRPGRSPLADRPDHAAGGVELKIRHRGGYEHFKVTTQHRETEEGRLTVYEWFERTEIAE